MASLTAAGPDKTEELPTPYSIHVATHFDHSAEESTTSSINKGSLGTNGSDLNKDNIIKPTFNNLTEEDRKALEAYRTEVDELFLSHYEVTW
jgi:ribosome recycling factor